MKANLSLPVELTARQQDLVSSMRELARSKFAPRADAYDRESAFPAEDFADLFNAGMLSVVVPPEHGGLGLGPYQRDVFALWLMTKEIAKVDLSLARCWEGHSNSMVLVHGMGTQEQKKRW